MDIREFSSLLGFLAFVVMAYRLVSTWDESDWLVRALAGGVMALLFVGSLGSAVYAAADLAGIRWVQWLVLISRTVGLLVGVLWPRLVGQTGIPLWRRSRY